MGGAMEKLKEENERDSENAHGPYLAKRAHCDRVNSDD